MINKKLIKKLREAGFFVSNLLTEKIDDSIEKLEGIKEGYENDIATTEQLQKELFMIINNLEYITDLLEISDRLDYFDDLSEDEKNELCQIDKHND